MYASLPFRLKAIVLFLLVVCIAALMTESSSHAQESTSGKRLKAMLVTGGCCHDYDAQRLIVTEGLAQRLGPIDWTIHQYGTAKDDRATIYDNADWAKGYDLIVHNECFGAMKDAALVQRIVNGHYNEKVPAIFIHCSMHSYRTSEAADAWRSLIGVTSTFHESKHRRLDVVPTDEGRKSGLVAPLNDGWKTPNGELYVITKVWPGTRVLATSYSTEQKADQPVIWTREENGIRVFGITLGHHNETVRSEPWQQIVAAGAKWALKME